MSPARQQLPLPFPHQPVYDPRDVLPGACNEAALAWLERTADWPDRRLAIWGGEGCGKTHLLRAWAARTGAVLLDGRGLATPDALPDSGAVAIDDAEIRPSDGEPDGKPDRPAAETTLLHVLNTARDRGLFLLLSGRRAPARWTVALPDLSSRLRAITAVEILPPDDGFLRLLFGVLLADRQLVVPDPVREWLLRRLPRSPAALRDAVARLDRLSLADGRRVTRALASRLLPAPASASEGTEEESAVDLPLSGESWEDRGDPAADGVAPSTTTGLV
ncbi:HdaA/DnaA family protein [Rhodopila sp.]|jgi:chromosomal replication initiation ATPase DnaA|uniref:HdaA/DnaA family protein n=1 Tax=Rhodopila sp. TaxID=2480087 RepID=UPI002BBAABF5|nr:chromosomal replication initiator DnaA [Rhodopila sp.]HVZ09596.1 chromosomal replication initiator DnaA [Rhodopila sp.]